MQNVMELSVPDQVAYWKGRRMLVHDQVYRIKIEPSLGCNRDCTFCGMTRKESKIMSPETHKEIVGQLPETVKRVEYILHGEPTLNKNLLSFFKELKEKSPKTQIAVSTNGWRFLEYEYSPEYFFELFEAGANVVQLSLYDKEDFDQFSKLVKENKEKIDNEKIAIKSLYGTHENLFGFKGNKKREVLYVEEFEGLNSGGSLQRRFHTFGGNIPHDLWNDYAKKPIDFSKFPMTGKGKTCASLLKYLSVGAHGDLYLCCRDASHSILLGNIHKDNLEELWWRDEVFVLRRVMRAARRDLMAPCFLCSRFCYRDPLYPYWGKDYTEKECIETVHKMTHLKDDVLLDNLIAYREVYPKNMPDHIYQEIDDAVSKYRRNK